jgi:signal transduction histidine kinase
MVYGDERRIQQIFQNVLANAVKYTLEEGTIEISLQLERKMGDDTHIVFTIKDTGIGIDKYLHTSIFKIFGMLNENVAKNQTGFLIKLF